MTASKRHQRLRIADYLNNTPALPTFSLFASIIAVADYLRQGSESYLAKLIVFLVPVISGLLIFSHYLKVRDLKPIRRASGIFSPFRALSGSDWVPWRRAQLVSDIVTQLIAEPHHHLILSGESGTGKSVLMRDLLPNSTSLAHATNFPCACH